MLSPNCMFHIYNRANGNEDLFKSHENYDYFLRKYSHFINLVADTYAYVLMPNHFQFMIRVKDDALLRENLDLKEGAQVEKHVVNQFSKLFNAYAKAFNKMYSRRGSLFQRPFKYKQVENEEYFNQLILYIHNNPVKHGFVSDLNQWPHSSFREYNENRNGVVQKTDVLDWFGSINEFRKCHENIENYQSVFD